MNIINQSQLSKYNYNKVSFGRKLRNDEKPEYEKTINDAYDYLGIMNRALIIHGSSFPAEKISDKNKISSEYYSAALSGKNPYIGTPYLDKNFNSFVITNGFNFIQLGPNGKLNKRDRSPYHASIFAKNEFFLNYNALKSEKYANILSDDDLKDIVIIKKNEKINYDMADFDEAKAISKMVTKRAYKNFKTKLEDGDKKAKMLNQEFEKFKTENDYWLEKDSVFRLFSDIHGSDNFEKWDNELDKNLIKELNNGNPAAIARYNQVKNKPRSAHKIDEYKFVQFLLDKQEKDDKKMRADMGMKYIGDLLVGYSFADEWANPEIGRAHV